MYISIFISVFSTIITYLSFYNNIFFYQDIGYKDCLFKMLSHSNNDQHFTHAFEVIFYFYYKKEFIQITFDKSR